MNYAVTFQLKYDGQFPQSRPFGVACDMQSSRSMQDARLSMCCRDTCIGKLLLKNYAVITFLLTRESEGRAMSWVQPILATISSFHSKKRLQGFCLWLQIASSNPHPFLVPYTVLLPFRNEGAVCVLRFSRSSEQAECDGRHWA